MVLEHLPVGVGLIGADGTILRLNAASERIWAASRKVGVDRYGDYKGWRADTGRPIEAHEWTWARAITKGEASLGEVVDIEAFDGTRKTIRNSAVPLWNGGGKIIGAVVVNEDITERRAAQQALEDSETRYRVVVETAVDAMVIIDEQGLIQSFNRSAERIFGYEAREVIGIIGISRDITERTVMEDELRRAKAEAEEANLAKSKFLAAASHDLRQPMQSLFLFSAALAPHVANERGQKTLTLLDRGLETLKALLDSLLDVSRLDAGVIRPEIGNVALAEIVADIEAAYAPVARARGLTLKVERSCGVAVRSDPMLLGRMIRNLVENAIRYTERGEVRIGCAVADSTVRVEVSDTGIGIPPEHLERIFEEFHQVANIERDRSQGLGLGLAIVKRLSKLLDHPVRVRSEPGSGSVFAIDVPLGLMDALPDTAPCAPPRPRGQVCWR